MLLACMMEMLDGTLISQHLMEASLRFYSHRESVTDC